MRLPTTDQPSYLTLREVAPILRFSSEREALAALRRQGARFTRIGRRWLIERAELDRVLALCAVKP